MVLVLSTFIGCGESGQPALVVATTWPLADRQRWESLFQENSSNPQLIDWVVLAPGESLASVVDRRGGVDLVVASLASNLRIMAKAGRFASIHAVDRTSGQADPQAEPTPGWPSDPRTDPASLELAKITLSTEGWANGYDELVRGNGLPRSMPIIRKEFLALIQGAPHSAKATQFIQSLQSRGLARSTPFPANDPRGDVDELLADLLGSSLVDAHEELVEAKAALSRFGHPSKAEVAIGERPPWPPASVAKLQANPNGEELIDTLLGQIAPDLESRDWLLESWSKPKRPIDGDLLADLATVLDGRLVREPRFRAWLRGEWTAWNRQLYRRVARVAGGYNPS